MTDEAMSPLRRRMIEVLISVQMFAGVATLFLIAPAALSIVHQVGPIFMLAASLVFLKSSQGTDGAAPIRAQPAR